MQKMAVVVPRFARACAVVCVCITASYSIAYNSLQHFSFSAPGGSSDAGFYYGVYQGKPVSGSFWPGRLMTPYLARAVPGSIAYWCAPSRQVDDAWVAKVRFACVNFVFLVVAGCACYAFLRRCECTVPEGLIGVLLWYTARPVVQYSGAPMAEAAAYCFLALCFYALAARLPLAFAGFFAAGLFAKEALWLMVPAVFLMRSGRRAFVAAALPGVALYIGVSIWQGSYLGRLYAPAGLFSMVPERLNALRQTNVMADLISAYGLILLPAVYALIRRRAPVQIMRWMWLAAVTALAILIGHISFGKTLLYVFPVVIACALYGIRAWCAERT